MRYLIALLLPPLAVLLCGKLIQFFLNIALCLCFWIPGILHALLVVSSTMAEERNERLVVAMGGKPRHRSFRLSMSLLFVMLTVSPSLGQVSRQTRELMHLGEPTAEQNERRAQRMKEREAEAVKFDPADIEVRKWRAPGKGKFTGGASGVNGKLVRVFDDEVVGILPVKGGKVMEAPIRNRCDRDVKYVNEQLEKKKDEKKKD